MLSRRWSRRIGYVLSVVIVATLLGGCADYAEECAADLRSQRPLLKSLGDWIERDYAILEISCDTTNGPPSSAGAGPFPKSKYGSFIASALAEGWEEVYPTSPRVIPGTLDRYFQRCIGKNCYILEILQFEENGIFGADLRANKGWAKVT